MQRHENDVAWKQEAVEMVERLATPGHGEINALILQALVRKLIAKKVLSVDEVREVLFEAATHLDVDGSPQTPQAARIIVEGDLVPVFLSGIGTDK